MRKKILAVVFGILAITLIVILVIDPITKLLSGNRDILTFINLARIIIYFLAGAGIIRILTHPNTKRQFLWATITLLGCTWISQEVVQFHLNQLSLKTAMVLIVIDFMITAVAILRFNQPDTPAKT